MVTQERIQIILETILKDKKNLDTVRNSLAGIEKNYANLAPQVIRTNKVMEKQEESMKALGKRNKFVAQWSDKLGVNTGRVTKIMQNQGLVFDKSGNIVDKAGRNVRGINNAMVQGKRDTRRFQMQWLSIMFAGMALQRTFSGLVKTSLEWVGVQELLNVTLGVVFLPIAESLLVTLLPIMEWFMELPEGVLKGIGVLALFGLAMGGLLATVGQVALGLGGLSWFTSGAGAGGKFISGIKSKLTGVNMASFLKMGGIVLSVAFAVKELSEGKLTAAIGAATTAVGFATGNPWIVGVGVVLTLLGDVELMTSIFEVGWRILDFVATISQKGKELVMSIFTGAEVDLGSLDLGKTAGEALNNLYEKGQLTSEVFNNLAEINAGQMMGMDIKKANDELANGLITWDEFGDKMDEIWDKYSKLIKKAEEFNETTSSIGSSKLSKSDLILKLLPPGNLKNSLQSVGDAIITPKGIVQTHPQDYIIATKTPETVGGNNITISPTYNVTVSDKREFEDMLDRNNRQLLNETRRITSR